MFLFWTTLLNTGVVNIGWIWLFVIHLFPACKDVKGDVLLLVDVSDSDGPIKHYRLQKFLKTLVDALQGESIKIGVYSFDQNVVVLSNLTHNTTRLKEMIDRMTADGVELSDMAAALRKMMTR